MNHFSYPLTIVQINIFEELQNIFPNQNPRPQTIEPPPPRIFNYRVPPWGVISFRIFGVIFSGIGETDSKPMATFYFQTVYTRCTPQSHLISSKYRVRSKSPSSRKSRRIFVRGLFTPSFPFCALPKTENWEM